MSTSISMSSALRIAPNVAARELNGEIVLLDLESGTYFGLDETGASIWHLIERYGDLQSVVDEMLAEYDVSSDTLRSDVITLVEALVHKRLLELAPAPGARR